MASVFSPPSPSPTAESAVSSSSPTSSEPNQDGEPPSSPSSPSAPPPQSPAAVPDAPPPSPPLTASPPAPPTSPPSPPLAGSPSSPPQSSPSPRSPSTSSSPPPPSTSSFSPPPSTSSSSPPPSTSASPPPPSTSTSAPPPSTSSSPPPPSTSSSPPPPPPSTSTSAPPPSTSTSAPPPSTSSSAPPPPPRSTSTTPPPRSTTSPPPSSASSPPPEQSISYPPPEASPPPSGLSPPPPPATAGGSPPPQSNPRPPSSTPPPPPPDIISPSPPPSVNVPTPPSSTGESPKVSPPSHKDSPPPPPDSQSPPSYNSPPPRSTVPSPPSSVPSSSAPPPVSNPGSPTNSSGSSAVTPSPSVTPERPIPIINGTNVTKNSSTTGKGGFSTGTFVAVGSMVGVLVLSLVIMAVWFVQKQKRRKKNIPYTVPSPFSSQNSDSFFIRARSSAPVVGSRTDSDFKYSSSEGGGVGNFAYDELHQATSGFSSNSLLGEGGFGCVYRGILADGRDVAVKQLKVGGGQGEREFRAEVEIISRVHHRHLVSLVGYCISDHQRLLVYDYVPNNTLHYHLHGENKTVLAWASRVRIASGAARGIAYLHEDCHPRIIHRDIKSSNILLDINFEAQVADFGLAKLALDSRTHVTTRVMGTFGYMAPEYATSGKLTDKSDVFSFGVVLLELITGRKPVDSSQPLGDESLVEWARPLLMQAIKDENFEELVDPRLDNNYIDREMFRMIEAAAACVRYSAVKRPRMSQVVRALDSLDEMPDLANGVKPGQSGVFDSAEHSAQIRMFQRMAFGSQDYSFSYSDRDQSRSYSQSQSSWSRESRDRPSVPINRSRHI